MVSNLLLKTVSMAALGNTKEGDVPLYIVFEQSLGRCAGQNRGHCGDRGAHSARGRCHYEGVVMIVVAEIWWLLEKPNGGLEYFNTGKERKKKKKIGGPVALASQG